MKSNVVTRLALAGANGRMGRSIVDMVRSHPDFLLVGSLEKTKPDADAILTANQALLNSVDVVIDFTNAGNSVALAEACAKMGQLALVIGSTGQSSDLLARIEVASFSIPIVRSGNFSFSVNLMLRLVEKASFALLPRSWDASIHETHHRTKRDRPSGTALMLRRTILDARMRVQDTSSIDGIFDVDVQSSRIGGIVGEHEIRFACGGESLSFSHSATSRDELCEGALLAAKWVVARPSGLYGMTEVLELQDI